MYFFKSCFCFVKKYRYFSEFSRIEKIYFRKHDLFHVIDDKIINLMDLDKKEALKLFLEHSDKLAPDTIVEKLQQSSR